MRVLLTGATGFVGRALGEELVRRGHTVRALVRRESGDRIPAGSGWEVSMGDILDTHACLRAVTGCDAVVHLVGIRRENPHTGTTYEAMHTEATYSIVDAARRKRVPRFVHMSALGTRPDAASRYHRTKWEAEEIVRRSGMRWTIFRPSVIFGEGDEFHTILVDLVQRPVVPIIDGGKSLLQPVARTNVVAAMADALTMPETRGEVYEVAGPERIAFVDLVEGVARYCGVWPNYVRVSSLLAKPMVRMLQSFRGFPLTYEELLLMLEDNVSDDELFNATFPMQLESYNAHMEALVHSALGRSAKKTA